MEYCVLWEEPCGHNEPGVGRFDHCLGWETAAWASLGGQEAAGGWGRGDTEPLNPKSARAEG